jgi:hypothetical protein
MKNILKYEKYYKIYINMRVIGERMKSWVAPLDWRTVYQAYIQCVCLYIHGAAQQNSLITL